MKQNNISGKTEYSELEKNLRRAILNIILLTNPILDYVELLEKHSANKIWARETKLYGNKFKNALLKQMKAQTNLWSEGVSEHLYMHIDIVEEFRGQITKLVHVDNHERLEELTADLKSLFEKYDKV